MDGTQTQGRHDALSWFTEFQLDCVIRNGIVPEWFHGIISRKVAEEMLLSNPTGYFLIRVSESRIGYTLSYRVTDRCRHFMIDVLKDNHYIIVGEDMRHSSLQDLVNFHRRVPIMPFNELLTVACGQVSMNKTDYAELLFPKRPAMKPNHGVLPNNPAHMNSSTHLKVAEDIPPALPHRPSTLSDPAGPPRNTSKPPVSPNTPSPLRLYPCLETELNALSFQTPSMVDHTAKPVPLPRKMHVVTTAQPDQPPELPARGPAIPQRKDKVQSSTTSKGPIESRTVGTGRPQTQPNTHHQDPHSNQQKNQDVKSVVSNLAYFKRKFHKKRSASQEHMYAEISVEDEQGQDQGKLTALEARDGDVDTAVDNEYQMLPGEIDNGLPPITAVTTVRPTDSGLPPEYLTPPPFAPGY
ncbi:hematopoietic SH2 domain-containing protein homolog [Salmo salar]|uniref:Hematopoietic SH2 domain-containing protein homolog n=1 Tax=Salmo salar TaxID=8030 RepID=A0A1S3T532_SALSA|nr:hematopoietic SH2 domain-containing protein homolog [Salmo salar]XP_014071703.1 hematopoietic SH2 domain-containing protein homolog [Salmo salar]|eukprot:XP_014071702.1 PREDICTED: hematopoietic SH2 domain-containing protein homolog [Salmo salar]